MSTNGTGSGGSGTRTLPVVIATSSVFGIVPCTSRRNVAWNNDGQCLLVTRQGVTVATPYMTTTLPKPDVMLDTSMQGGPQKVDEEDEDEDVEVDVDAGVGRRLARPRDGEIGWFMTTVGYDKSKNREDEYGWADVGDELTGIVTDRDKERTVRAATWSPSGLSDLGSPLLAVMSSTSQVSVFAPGDDLYSKQFTEIVDLTRTAIDMMPGEEMGALSVPAMLRVRATAMEWSPAVPLASMVGLDGSLLALANRAGGIDFWACGTGPDREFVRVGEFVLPRPWACEVTWGCWRVESESRCTSLLAIATTDGAIWTLPVTRGVADVDAGTWTLEIGELSGVAPADNRVTTALQWLTDDFMAWTKPGSVHLRLKSWAAPKMVRLERVGNWAGCNALGACVGLHLSGTTLTVVLSTLTYHLIHNATTEPTRAPPADSLRASLAARDVFLDCARRRRRGFYAANDREYTAHTAGWAAIDGPGDIVCWMAEPITFHNLDSATEVNRISDFVVANLKTRPEDSDAALAALGAVLSSPPNLLHNSPLGILLPHLVRLVAADEPMGQALCDLVARLPPAAALAPETSKAGVAAATAASSSPMRALMERQWGDDAPNALRVRLVLAQWGLRSFPNLTLEYGAAVESIDAQLQTALAVNALRWAGDAVPETGAEVGRLDALYLGYLFDVCGAAGVPASAERLRAHAADSGGGACPACGSAVRFGGGTSAFCDKGHEWERCSVTHLLITTPVYRLCTVCPAVSLLPDSVGQGAGAGAASASGNELVRTALEAAVECLSCGGRWARAV